jgi:hypothetical protein
VLAVLLVVAAAVGLGRDVHAYSVLTHQAIVDAVWAQSLAPLLRARYRGATPEDLEKARAYAYGGCIIQDMGYYPFSSKTFSDLTHYVRSADFIKALIDEAETVDEYAFALGALAHYAADTHGHSGAVNQAVPMIYPKVRAEHGSNVPYEKDPTAHIRTEFAFDVVQLARGSYLPNSFHRNIGFDVAKPVLERAFLRTYGLELGDVFGSLDLAIGTYRRSVSNLIPMLTKAAWDAKKDEIQERLPDATPDNFIFRLTRADYEQAYGREYKRPNFGHRILAFFIRLMPRIGPFKTMAFKVPTPEAEALFLKSFATTVDRYRALLGDVRADRLSIENRNLDTGRAVQSGDYGMADEMYAELVQTLAKKKFEGVPPALRANILQFYGQRAQAPEGMKAKEWARLQGHVAALRGSAPRD